jgi:tetratricopeptide (TPR) repeat protein
MPFEDRFGLTLTTSSALAAENYVRALDLMLSANIGAEELLDAALGADPEFALAYIARGRLLAVQARVAEARTAAEAARALVGRVTAREARHITTVATAIDGKGTEAMALLEEHVAEYPRDALVLSLALGVFGLLGFSGRADFHEAQLALLESLMPYWGEDWWFLTYLGRARIELGDIATGAREVEQALALNPANAYAAHARAHGYYEAGDAEGGAGFIEGWLPGYDRRSQLHGHLSWHLALCELARGNSGRAAALYADAIRPAVSHAPPLFNLADSASFLWRWQIYEETPPLDGEWVEVMAHASRFFRRPACISPISTQSSPRPHAMTTWARSDASHKPRSSPPAGAWRRARSCRASAPGPRRLPAAITQRPPTNWARCSPNWRGSAAVMRSARCSRTPSSPPPCAPVIMTKRGRGWQSASPAGRRRAIGDGSTRHRPGKFRRIRRGPSA